MYASPDFFLRDNSNIDIIFPQKMVVKLKAMSPSKRSVSMRFLFFSFKRKQNFYLLFVDKDTIKLTTFFFNKTIIGKFLKKNRK